MNFLPLHVLSVTNNTEHRVVFVLETELVSYHMSESICFLSKKILCICVERECAHGGNLISLFGFDFNGLQMAGWIRKQRCSTYFLFCSLFRYLDFFN